MKKTTKKLSLGMKIASVLACLAIVSVGFASWWIVKFPAPTKATDGQFEVYAVNTKSIHFSNIAWGTVDDADSDVVFGHPGSGTAVRWLGYDNDVQAQDLEAVLSFTVSVHNGEEVTDELDSGSALKNYLDTISLVFDPQSANFDAAIGNGIAAPKISYSLDGGTNWSDAQTYSADKYTLTINADTQTGNFADAFTTGTQVVMVKFEFGWEYTPAGDSTQTVNPYDYYNGKTYKDALATEAAGILSKINDIGNTTYKIDISTTPAGEANA